MTQSSIVRDFTLELQLSQESVYAGWFRSGLGAIALSIAIFGMLHLEFFTKNIVIRYLLKILAISFLLISIMIFFINATTYNRFSELFQSYTDMKYPNFGYRILSYIIMLPLLFVLIMFILA